MMFLQVLQEVSIQDEGEALIVPLCSVDIGFSAWVAQWIIQIWVCYESKAVLATQDPLLKICGFEAL